MEAAGERSTHTPRLLIAVGLIIAISLGHYLTPHDAVGLHNLHRRLYYIPILILAFSHEIKGGLLAAAACCAAYVPHAFVLDTHHSPSPTADKLLEMLMYLVVGGLSGWLVGRERTSQRALAAALEEQRDLEAQLVRTSKLTALGQMTSGLAHEIRNPLASILGSAEALSDEFPEGHRKHRVSTILLQEINRLNAVVSDFLKFARPREPNTTSVDLGQLATDVSVLTRRQAEQAGVSVTLELPDEALHAQGDEAQLAQVALNLVLNAIQAIESTKADVGHVCLRVASRRSGRRRYLCLGVQDDGPGIDENDREDVFNPYFTTRDEGTGLGLSISSRIAEAHGGFIDLEPEPTGGTSAWLYLPDPKETP